MPTAVITESKEKTASSRRIWMITLAKVGATWAEECPSSPSNFWWVSWVLLAMRNSPADQKDEVAPEISCAKTVKSGAVRPMTQEIEKSSTMRITIASVSPR
jgi:hypothetical protein